MEGLFYSPRCDRKPFIGLPRPVERADGEEDPGSWALPPNLLPWPPELLEPVPGLGRVCAELSSPALHWTPFQCALGYQPPLFPWSGEPSDVPSIDYWFRESERVWDAAHHQLQRAVRRRKMTADLRRSETPTYQPGQKVWLSTRDIRMCLPCKKLSPRYVGPFTITRQINPVTYLLQLPPQYRIHPSFHVSLLKPYHSPVSPSTEPGPTEEPPLPSILEDGTIYKVKEILDSRRRGGQLEYLVDWEGYGPEEQSWIPRNDILDPTLLEEFHSARLTVQNLLTGSMYVYIYIYIY